MICPELIVSMLFTEVMLPNEAVVVRGVERYAGAHAAARSATRPHRSTVGKFRVAGWRLPQVLQLHGLRRLVCVGVRSRRQRANVRCSVVPSVHTHGRGPNALAAAA